VEDTELALDAAEILVVAETWDNGNPDLERDPAQVGAVVTRNLRLDFATFACCTG
jgi:hypothetical protein